MKKLFSIMTLATLLVSLFIGSENLAFAQTAPALAPAPAPAPALTPIEDIQKACFANVRCETTSNCNYCCNLKYPAPGTGLTACLNNCLIHAGI